MIGDEELCRARLGDEGLEPQTWSNGPGDRYSAHAHRYDKVLVCVRGSIRFGLPSESEAVELRPGDRLDLPAGTVHDAVVGTEGVTCLEAHRPAGSLAGLRSPGRAWLRTGGREP